MRIGILTSHNGTTLQALIDAIEADRLDARIAVVEAGQQESGVTLHLVDEQYDTGAIVAQTRVPVLDDDTPESLCRRVMEREKTFIVEVFSAIAAGEL